VVVLDISLQLNWDFPCQPTALSTDDNAMASGRQVHWNRAASSLPPTTPILTSGIFSPFP